MLYLCLCRAFEGLAAGLCNHMTGDAAAAVVQCAMLPKQTLLTSNEAVIHASYCMKNSHC